MLEIADFTNYLGVLPRNLTKIQADLAELENVKIYSQVCSIASDDKYETEVNAFVLAALETVSPTHAVCIRKKLLTDSKLNRYKKNFEPPHETLLNTEEFIIACNRSKILKVVTFGCKDNSTFCETIASTYNSSKYKNFSILLFSVCDINTKGFSAFLNRKDLYQIDESNEAIEFDFRLFCKNNNSSRLIFFDGGWDFGKLFMITIN